MNIVHRGTYYDDAWFTAKVDEVEDLLRMRGVLPGDYVSLRASSFSPVQAATFAALTRMRCLIAPNGDGCEVDVEIFGNDLLRVSERSPRTIEFALTHAGLVLATSGTTGAPKHAAHDLDVMFERCRPSALRRATTLACDHLGGLDVMLRARGGTLVCPSSNAPADVFDACHRYRVQALSTTPSWLRGALASGESFPRLEVLTYGAECMTAALLDRLRAALPDTRLVDVYGLTEHGVVDRKLDGMRVVDGELQLRGGSFLGYLDASLDPQADGWLRTGDMVDAEGRIIGRESSMINVGGAKVSPEVVEDALVAAGAMDARAYAIPNALLGHVVACDFVGGAYLPTAALRQACKATLPPHAVPARFTRVTAIERNARGKVTRRA